MASATSSSPTCWRGRSGTLDWTGQRDVPRPVEYIKIDRSMIREKTLPTTDDQRPTTTLSFRFMEPLEEAVTLIRCGCWRSIIPPISSLSNEYFASNPPYPEFKVVVSKSKDALPPAGAWDEHGHDVLPELLAHRYFGDFALTQFQGFAKPHSLTLDLGEAYGGGPLWLLLHGESSTFRRTACTPRRKRACRRSLLMWKRLM